MLHYIFLINYTQYPITCMTRDRNLSRHTGTSESAELAAGWTRYGYGCSELKSPGRGSGFFLGFSSPSAATPAVWVALRRPAPKSASGRVSAGRTEPAPISSPPAPFSPSRLPFSPPAGDSLLSALYFLLTRRSGTPIAAAGLWFPGEFVSSVSIKFHFYVSLDADLPP